MMKTVKEKLELLEKIAYYFNKENVEWALGASMLLYFKGITTEFHDIDLMVSTSFVLGILNMYKNDLSPDRKSPRGYMASTVPNAPPNVISADGASIKLSLITPNPLP